MVRKLVLIETWRVPFVSGKLFSEVAIHDDCQDNCHVLYPGLTSRVQTSL